VDRAIFKASKASPVTEKRRPIIKRSARSHRAIYQMRMSTGKGRHMKRLMEAKAICLIIGKTRQMVSKRSVSGRLRQCRRSSAGRR
jgi:hypothetical protein